MKSVTVYTPTRRLGRPKANFLVYPDPNHLGAQRRAVSAASRAAALFTEKQTLSERGA